MSGCKTAGFQAVTMVFPTRMEALEIAGPYFSGLRNFIKQHAEMYIGELDDAAKAAYRLEVRWWSFQAEPVAYKSVALPWSC